MFMMKSIIGCLLGVAATAVSTHVAAQSEPWSPGGPVRIITPSPVGVGTDAFARLYADHLGRELKASVFVENRPGAASTIGTDAVAKAPPNGLTLLVSTSLPFTTAPYLLAKVPYNAQKDLVPIAPLYRGGSFLIASPAFKGQTLNDLVASARQAPSAINYASYGPGTTSHLGMEMLQDAAGIELTHIPYKQSPLPDLIAGRVLVGWEPPISALPNIRSGKVRALAYSGDRRNPAAPDVPTLAETLPGFEVFTWVGVWAPAGTPEPVLARLHEAFSKVTRHPDVLKALAEAGNEAMSGTGVQMQSMLEREAQTMSRLIKAKNIKLN